MIGDGMLILIFSILMIFIGINMLRTAHTRILKSITPNPSSYYRRDLCRATVSILGVGDGFLIVPALL